MDPGPYILPVLSVTPRLLSQEYYYSVKTIKEVYEFIHTGVHHGGDNNNAVSVWLDPFTPTITDSLID